MAALVTFTVTVHEPLAGMGAPESATLAPLFTAVTVPPAQVVAPPAAAVFTSPAGYASVNAAPVMALALELASVMVRTDVPLTPIGFGLNAFASVACAITVKVAEAPAELPALVVVIAPVEFRYAPAAALVTFTVTLHEPLGGTVPPESATLLPFAAAVTVAPAQLVEAPGAAVFTRPAGYVSVKAAPVAANAFGLTIVIVSTEASFVPIEDGVKPFAAPGEVATVSVAFAATVLAPALVVVSAPAAIALA